MDKIYLKDIEIFANHGANDMDYVLLGYGTFKDSFRISVN